MSVWPAHVPLSAIHVWCPELARAITHDRVSTACALACRVGHDIDCLLGWLQLVGVCLAGKDGCLYVTVLIGALELCSGCKDSHFLHELQSYVIEAVGDVRGARPHAIICHRQERGKRGGGGH